MHQVDLVVFRRKIAYPTSKNMGPINLMLEIEAVNYLSICDVDGQIYVTERSRSNFSDKLVFSTDYEFGLGATAARHNIHQMTISTRFTLENSVGVSSIVSRTYKVLYVQLLLMRENMD